MRILLIDACPLLFKVFSGPVQTFTTAAGEPTGLRFGVIRAVRAYEKKLKPDRIALVWDATGSGDGPRFDNERGYKGNRDHTSDLARAIWSGITNVQAMLALTKYTQAWAEGFEADDVIGAVARQLAEQGNEVVIHSVDRDLWQLFAHPRIVGWENDKKQGKFIGPGEVIGHFGVAPKHLLFYRAVEGDPSDNLRGIGLASFKLGEVKNWLAATGSHDTLEGYVGALSEERKDLYSMIVDDGERRRRLESNYELMTLRTPDAIEFRRGASDALRLESLFKALEMNSLVPRVAEFAPSVDDIF